MTHFNQLTPAEAERLAMLAEECGEVIQIVGKILRHGYESHHPDDPRRVSNRDLLNKEILDMNTIVQRMAIFNDIEGYGGPDLDEAWARKLRFTHHQGDEHEHS